MAKAKALIAIAAVLPISACASMTTGTSQSVSISTTPKSGASCEARNEKGAWALPSTPGSITVSKSASDLTATCKTQDGMVGTASIASTTAGAAFGNILVGGIIGAAVDMSSGAAYQYPSQMVVPLVEPGQAPAQDQPNQPQAAVVPPQTTKQD